MHARWYPPRPASCCQMIPIVLVAVWKRHRSARPSTPVLADHGGAEVARAVLGSETLPDGSPLGREHDQLTCRGLPRPDTAGVPLCRRKGEPMSPQHCSAVEPITPLPSARSIGWLTPTDRPGCAAGSWLSPRLGGVGGVVSADAGAARRRAFHLADFDRFERTTSTVRPARRWRRSIGRSSTMAEAALAINPGTRYPGSFADGTDGQPDAFFDGVDLYVRCAGFLRAAGAAQGVRDRPRPRHPGDHGPRRSAWARRC